MAHYSLADRQDRLPEELTVVRVSRRCLRGAEGHVCASLLQVSDEDRRPVEVNAVIRPTINDDEKIAF